MTAQRLPQRCSGEGGRPPRSKRTWTQRPEVRIVGPRGCGPARCSAIGSGRWGILELGSRREGTLGSFYRPAVMTVASAIGAQHRRFVGTAVFGSLGIYASCLTPALHSSSRHHRQGRAPGAGETFTVSATPPWAKPGEQTQILVYTSIDSGHQRCWPKRVVVRVAQEASHGKVDLSTGRETIRRDDACH